ncbi:hypothetical protein [Acinetobacter nosocomialis]|uniref:hypothetical protein n=1 Tax=Acinetobacter nosocomialis TaxID=106654 RepID=UPI003D3662CC
MGSNNAHHPDLHNVTSCQHRAAHSNSGKHGKGKGIKASDAFTVPLCHKCHFLFDTYQLGTRQESETMFERWLEKTELMLKIDTKSDDVF